jgi:hypothetical protein
MANKSVIVNQVPYDFYSLELEVAIDGGESFGIIDGFEELEYTVTINREKMYGRSRLPRKRTDGDAEFEASLTLHQDAWHFIRKKLKESGIPIARAKFNITVSYFAEDEELVSDTLTEVAIAELGSSHSRGPEGLTKSMPIDPMNIYFDGEDVFGGKLAA